MDKLFTWTHVLALGEPECFFTWIGTTFFNPGHKSVIHWLKENIEHRKVYKENPIVFNTEVSKILYEFKSIYGTKTEGQINMKQPSSYEI